MSVNWNVDGNFPVNPGGSFQFHSNNSINRPQVGISPTPVNSIHEDFSVTVRLKVNTINTNDGYFKLFEFNCGSPSSFYSIFVYKDVNAQIKIGLTAQLGPSVFTSTLTEIVAKNKYYNVSVKLEQDVPGVSHKASFIVDGRVFDEMSLNWPLPHLHDFLIDGDANSGVNNLNIFVDIQSFGIHAPPQIPPTEYATQLPRNQCVKPPCTSRPGEFVFINWLTNQCETLPNPDYTYPFIPTQKRVHAQLADGSVAYPIDLSQIQKVSNVPVTNLAFILEDGTLQVWDFSNVKGRKRVLYQNGSIFLSESTFTDILSSKSVEVSCGSADAMVGITSAFKICSIDRTGYITLSKAPKCCCDGYDDDEYQEIMTLNNP